MTSAGAPTMTSEEATARARQLLPDLAGPGATLRDDQATAVAALVVDRRRVLCVQRTGWGKSAVYFLATRLLRERGAGPTLIVSPLLSLMRDQLAAAAGLGLVAETINSSNRDEWDDVAERVATDAVDVLLISPERLNHPGFRADVLEPLALTVGLLVVDEAHCISDWGHDFRPDYRRIADVLARLPDATPVLATTATANDRVVADVAEQLGADPLTLRGDLDRESLVCDVRELGSASARLAWLAEWIPTVDGAGIVYCLTVADATRAAEFLAAEGIAAASYTGQTDADERARVEAALKTDDVTVVCATTALSMGYDKPDLAFVAHYGLPASPVAYYQAIGRAGRALERAWVVALPGQQDEAIWAHFDAQALPPPAQIDEVVSALANLCAEASPVSTARLEQIVNARRSRLELILKVCDVEGAVERVAGGWIATGQTYQPDPDRIERVAAARHAEAEAMRRYAASETCLMAQLRAELDDLDGRDPADPSVACGRCARCTGVRIGPDAPAPATVDRAQRALRSAVVELAPRKQWPSGTPGRRGRLTCPHQPGRALAIGTDHGWDEALTTLLAFDGDPAAPDAPEDIAAALADVCDGITSVLAAWDWVERPTWVCAVPSRRRPWLAVAVADELAVRGRLARADVLTRAGDTAPQRSLRNSAQQAAAADAAWAPIDAQTAPTGACLLVDDVAHSGWTLAVAAERIGQANGAPVLPLVLLRQP